MYGAHAPFHVSVQCTIVIGIHFSSQLSVQTTKYFYLFSKLFTSQETCIFLLISHLFYDVSIVELAVFLRRVPLDGDTVVLHRWVDTLVCAPRGPWVNLQ